MKKKMNIVVIGSGRFGSEIIRVLASYSNFKTILIEKNPEQAETIKDLADEIYIGDTTNENFIKKLDLNNADIFVIGIGDNIQNSILTASIIKEKFKNKLIIAKVVDDRHEEILKTLGIKETLNPQKTAARRALMKIFNPYFAMFSYENIFELSSKISIIRIGAKKEWINKTIIDLNLPKNINIMLIMRNQKPIISAGSTLIKENDLIMLVGENQIIKTLIENRRI